MAPRTLNTKTRRRGTAWRATEKGVDEPTILFPVSTKNCSPSPDPDFDFDKWEEPRLHQISPKKLSGIKSSSSSSSPSPSLDVKSPARVLPLQATEQSANYQETDQKIKALEAKIQELEKDLQNSQTNMKTALEEKDTQLQKMARDLQESQQERDLLKDRLVKAECSLQSVHNNMQTIKQEVTNQKEALKDSSESISQRFARIETTVTESQAAITKMTEMTKNHDNPAIGPSQEMKILQNRCLESEREIDTLKESLAQQADLATQQRREWKHELQSITSLSKSKDDRIKKLEMYIQESAADAVELKALLSQLNRTLGPAAQMARKRKKAEPPADRPDNQKKAARPSRGVSDWLQQYRHPIYRGFSKDDRARGNGVC